MPRKRKSRLTDNNIALIGAFLLLVGAFFLSYNYVQAKRLIAYEYMDSLFVEEEVTPEEIEPVTQEITKEEEKSNSVPNNPITYHYIGYLEIPKINFRKGIVDKNSKDNNVNKNLFIASNSTYPDVEKGNLIIAGHSGTGYKAFFKELYKLEKGDTAKVEYNGKNYYYQVTKIYEQPKTGKIAIYRNYDKTTLTLVTCTKDKNNKQTVYILELVNIE